MATLALLDASNYLYRAFYAIRGLTGPGGRPTNAVYGFLNMWRKYREVRKPDAVAVAFDRYEKTFREEMDANYKAQRQAMPDDLVPQIEDAKRLCRLLGLAVVEEAGYEADDLIGSIAVAAASSGMRAEICSADKDLFQLVKDPDVAVWHPVEGNAPRREGRPGVLRCDALAGRRRPRAHGRLVGQHPRRQGRR